ncbi:MAG: gliding motility-associated C-terminal domain-containing protein [Sphingobacteriaceae bacterium]|nr:gliding motility-associated C-terminal domain-containing protein [Cytophagaceae bacterium]
MVIYRKEGCGDPDPDKCLTTPPAGYVEVGRVAIGMTTFTDDNGGKGFTGGTRYSYRIQVAYPGPALGASAASNAVCAALPRQVPYITNVTVDKTGPGRDADGEITLRWTRPFGISPTLTGPFEYRLLRVTGLTANPTTQIARIPTSFTPGVADTVFVDKGLNTTANAYRYRIVVYYTLNGNLTVLDSTEAASSVRLAAQPAVRAISLSWQANVPWRNQSYRVFREIPGQPGVFNQIADNQTGPVYVDNGTDNFPGDGVQTLSLSPESTYCYRVQTVGSYGIPEVPGPLLNFSQVICAMPTDTTRPCPPVLALDPLKCEEYVAGPCEQPPFNNKLSWTYPAKSASGADCDPNIVKYNVYYKRYEEDETFTKIDSVTSPRPPATLYTHANLPSYAGCYYVTAVNKFGNESRPSNTVCKDNCPSFMLPNVFTPNNDGQNDTFQPMNCPRFVQSVTFTVYNRYGAKVFVHEGDPLITWGGVTTDGKDLPAGLYYYQAEVRFQRLSRNDELQSFKGWIQLLR